ncbi:MAG TPA: Ig-like domain-containing protein [Blastocatellia bacterium]|nr:Ig-like domain-containing protein [Blastocatellia bacterium]
MKKYLFAPLQTLITDSFCRCLIVAAILLAAASFSHSSSSASARPGDNPIPVTTVSAASYETGAIAPGAIVASFGTLLATRLEVASSLPLPTTLAGTTVRIKDSAGVERPAPLFFVSAGQINLVVPVDTATGTATVTVRSEDGTASTGTMEVKPVGISVFTANSDGQGVPAASALRIKADGTQIFEEILQFDATLGRRRTKAIDLGPEAERVFLILYLTGIRRAPDPNGDGNSNESVHLVVGGTELVPAYAGAQGIFAGLDQINAEIPRSLLGRGRINLTVTGPAASSNPTEIEIGPPAGGARPVVSSFSTGTALAGQTLGINGSGFATAAAGNLVRIGGNEARVTAAAATQLSVIIPFGAESGPVSVRTGQGEGMSAGALAVRTSISGVVENTARQPMPGIGVKVTGTAITATSNNEGTFILPDVPAGAAIVEIDGTNLGVVPPYPKVTLKTIVNAQRDNPFQRPIAIQQAIGPGLLVGSPGDSPEKPGSPEQPSRVEATSGLVRSGSVIFEVPDNAKAVFPGGATSGVVTLTIVENSRTPAPLPSGQFSSTIVQLTPFGVKLTPGGKLTFPNSDGYPAGTQAKLFRFDQTPGSPTIGSFIEAGTAAVSGDGQRIETSAGAITETSYYFASIPRQTTTVAGRVVDSDGATPVRLAFVRVRGQETFTDGNGGFTLRNVPLNSANEGITVEASFVRPGGRVDRVQRSGVPVVINGLTKVTPDLVLTAPSSNRPPVILAPSSAVVTRGETRDFKIVISDPDGDQTGQVTTSGASFAVVSSVAPSGTYNLRLTPGANDAGNYNLGINVADSLGANTTQFIAVRVNRAPVASAQTVSLGAGAPKAITLAASDQDGDPLQFIITGNPTGGVLSGTAPNLIYTPNPGFSGGDSFTFKVNDNVIDSGAATVTINVTAPGTVLRTLVHHQITSFAGNFNTGTGQAPVLSANGNRAVYAMAPGTEDPANPNRIFVINADGTGVQQVDSYTTLCFCGSQVDISADGSKVISTEGLQLRIANADGSGALELIRNVEIATIRIAGDGSKVFFLIRRDSGPKERGLYVINADGSGLRQIVGPNQVASLLSIPAGEVFPFASDLGNDLGVSSDGSRIVFATYSRGQRMFGVNPDGTGLHQIIGPIDFVRTTGISADGSKVLYRLNSFATGLDEVGVINFDGTAQRKLADNDINGPTRYLGESGDRYSLSADGSRLLAGSSGIVFDTATGVMLQLSARFGGFGLLYNSLYLATMNSTATRFLFAFGDASGINQLVSLDVNPASLGAAPSLTAPAIDPLFVLTNGGSGATVTARMTTTNTLLLMEYVFLRGGLFDRDSSFNALYDDGLTAGDAKSGDGVFTSNTVSTNCCTVVGPRTARLNAMVRTADGRLHATSVDFAPFFVLAQAPGPTAPAITSLAPPNGAPGAQVTINGSGFDPTAAGNVVLFGNRVAQVASANAGGTQLVVTVPADVAVGTVAVTVSASGRTSNAVNFTVPSFNLLRNGDAEQGTLSTTGLEIVPIPGWTTTSNFTAPVYGLAGCMSSAEGLRVGGGRGYFVGGPGNTMSTATQTVDVSSAATQIDAGQGSVTLQGQLAGVQTDTGTVRAEFLNGNSVVIGSFSLGPVTGTAHTFQFKTATSGVPAGTRSIRVTLISTGGNSNYNEGYFENLFLGLN